MRVFSKISEIRRYRWADPASKWGLVPTMGFLHEGHLSLIRRARQENDYVGVSIFVNPKQFDDPKDETAYPRDMEHDLSLLEKEKVDLVWTPTPEIVYPAGFQTYVTVDEVTRRLEGSARPGHFRGVTTIVAKLFNVFQPHTAYFGQKDAQQAIAIERMVHDLSFNIKLAICPTVREADGLAMSSRNARLSSAGRKKATCLYRALLAAKKAFDDGVREAAQLRNRMLAELNIDSSIKVDYVSVAHPKTLKELKIIERHALLSLAVFIEGVRLIDNLLCSTFSPNQEF